MILRRVTPVDARAAGLEYTAEQAAERLPLAWHGSKTSSAAVERPSMAGRLVQGPYPNSSRAEPFRSAHRQSSPILVNSRLEKCRLRTESTDGYALCEIQLLSNVTEDVKRKQNLILAESLRTDALC